MLHGLLLGQKGEFFIERIEPSSDAEVRMSKFETPIATFLHCICLVGGRG